MTAIKKRAGSDCMRQVPYENPTTFSEAMENIHFLAQWIAEIDCRRPEEFTCERLREMFEECGLCELVCLCVCPPETRALVQFDGVPFENIYAGDADAGTNWIGNVDPTSFGTDSGYYKIFDPATGAKVGEPTSDDNTVFHNRSGWGADPHPDRDEVWISGYSLNGGVSRLAVRVHHARAPFQLLAHYAYPTHDGGFATAPIKHCPKTGDIYVGYNSRISNGFPGVVRISASDGTIVGDAQPLDVASGPSLRVPHYMIWDEARELFVIGGTRDNQWTLDPVTMQASGMSPEVGSIAKTGDYVPESTYDFDDARLYLVPERHDSQWRWTINPGDPVDTEEWIDWAGSDFDPEGNFSFYLSDLETLVISRGTATVVWNEPDSVGRVTLYRTSDATVERDILVGYEPARSCHCIAQNKVSVVTHWAQDSPWFVEFIPLEPGSDLTIRNPRDEEGQEVPGGGPYTPPDEEVEDPPDETSPPDEQIPPAGPVAPCSPAPELVSGFAWCEKTEDSDDPGTFLVTTGWQITIVNSYCGPVPNTDVQNQYDIVGWNVGRNPAVDAPDETWHYYLPWTIPAPPGQQIRRETVFQRAGADAAVNCGGVSGNPTVIQRTYYIRRNQPGESGPGPLSTNSVTLIFTDPAT